MQTPPYDEAEKAAYVARYLAGESAYGMAREPKAPQYRSIIKWVKDAQRAVDLKDVIRSHIPTTVVTNAQIIPHKPKRVLVVPDMHHPFCHPDTLEFLKAVRDAYKTDAVVCLGDEIDACAFSRYPMNPDGMTAGKELAAAIEHLRPFYREFPDVLVCESNHTVRPWKKAFDAGLPAAFLPTVSKILDAPDGWVWKMRHEVDGVLYTHGDNGKSGQYAAANYMKQAKQSVVIGHVHAYASVFYEGAQFGMNAGCLIDKEAYCFHYAKGALLDVNIGCGVVIDGKQAHFVPMLMDDNKRWVGKL
jgi:predicted phosphodiesterase